MPWRCITTTFEQSTHEVIKKRRTSCWLRSLRALSVAFGISGSTIQRIIAVQNIVQITSTGVNQKLTFALVFDNRNNEPASKRHESHSCIGYNPWKLKHYKTKHRTHISSPSRKTVPIPHSTAYLLSSLMSLATMKLRFFPSIASGFPWVILMVHLSLLKIGLEVVCGNVS
jgi:hypothetical protein